MPEPLTRQSNNSWLLLIQRWGLHQYKELVAAVHFLSILPMPGGAQLFNTNETDASLVIGSAYFPLVGLLIGSLAEVFTSLVGPLLPPLVLSALLVVTSILLTGGLHLDGLMDTCDGFFGGRGRERKLEIMRDSRVGSFGVLGGVSILLLKFALFASPPDLRQLALSFLLVSPISRWTMVLAIYLFPGARPQGLAAAVRQTVSLPRLLIAGSFTLIIVLIVGHFIGLIVWLLASLVALIIGAFITRTLGGLTGDVYGAIAEITEVTCFLLLIWLRF